MPEPKKNAAKKKVAPKTKAGTKKPAAKSVKKKTDKPTKDSPKKPLKSKLTADATSNRSKRSEKVTKVTDLPHAAVPEPPAMDEAYILRVAEAVKKMESKEREIAQTQIMQHINSQVNEAVNKARVSLSPSNFTEFGDRLGDNYESGNQTPLSIHASNHLYPKYEKLNSDNQSRDLVGDTGVLTRRDTGQNDQNKTRSREDRGNSCSLPRATAGNQMSRNDRDERVVEPNRDGRADGRYSPRQDSGNFEPNNAARAPEQHPNDDDLTHEAPGREQRHSQPYSPYRQDQRRSDSNNASPRRDHRRSNPGRQDNEEPSHYEPQSRNDGSVEHRSREDYIHKQEHSNSQRLSFAQQDLIDAHDHQQPTPDVVNQSNYQPSERKKSYKTHETDAETSSVRQVVPRVIEPVSAANNDSDLSLKGDRRGRSCRARSDDYGSRLYSGKNTPSQSGHQSLMTLQEVIEDNRQEANSSSITLKKPSIVNSLNNCDILKISQTPNAKNEMIRHIINESSQNAYKNNKEKRSSSEKRFSSNNGDIDPIIRDLSAGFEKNSQQSQRRQSASPRMQTDKFSTNVQREQEARENQYQQHKQNNLLKDISQAHSVSTAGEDIIGYQNYEPLQAISTGPHKSQVPAPQDRNENLASKSNQRYYNPAEPPDKPDPQKRENLVDNGNSNSSEDKCESSTDSIAAKKIEVLKVNSHSGINQLAVLNNRHNNSSKMNCRHDSGLYTEINRYNSASNMHTHSDILTNQYEQEKDTNACDLGHRKRISFAQFDLDGCKPINIDEFKLKAEHEVEYRQQLNQQRKQYTDHVRTKNVPPNNKPVSDNRKPIVNQANYADNTETEVLIQASPVLNKRDFNNEMKYAQAPNMGRPFSRIDRHTSSASDNHPSSDHKYNNQEAIPENDIQPSNYTSFNNSFKQIPQENLAQPNSLNNRREPEIKDKPPTTTTNKGPNNANNGLANMSTTDILSSDENGEHEHFANIRCTKRNCNSNLVSGKIRCRGFSSPDSNEFLSRDTKNQDLKTKSPENSGQYSNIKKNSDFSPTISSKCDVRLSLAPVDGKSPVGVFNNNAAHSRNVLAGNTPSNTPRYKEQYNPPHSNERRFSDNSHTNSVYLPTSCSKQNFFLSARLINQPASPVDNSHDQQTSSAFMPTPDFNIAQGYGNNKSIRRVDEKLTLFESHDDRKDEIKCEKSQTVGPDWRTRRQTLDADGNCMNDSYVNYLPSGYMDSISVQGPTVVNTPVQQQQPAKHGVDLNDGVANETPARLYNGREDKIRTQNVGHPCNAGEMKKYSDQKATSKQEPGRSLPIYSNMASKLDCRLGLSKVEEKLLNTLNPDEDRSSCVDKSDQKFNIFIDIKPTNESSSQAGDVTELVIPINYSEYPSYNVSFGIKPSHESRRSHSANPYRKPTREQEEYTNMYCKPAKPSTDTKAASNVQQEPSFQHRPTPPTLQQPSTLANSQPESDKTATPAVYKTECVEFRNSKMPAQDLYEELKRDPPKRRHSAAPTSRRVFPDKNSEKSPADVAARIENGVAKVATVNPRRTLTPKNTDPTRDAICNQTVGQSGTRPTSRDNCCPTNNRNQQPQPQRRDIHSNMTNYIGDIIYNDSRMFKKETADSKRLIANNARSDIPLANDFNPISKTTIPQSPFSDNDATRSEQQCDSINPKWKEVPMDLNSTVAGEMLSIIAIKNDEDLANPGYPSARNKFCDLVKPDISGIPRLKSSNTNVSRKGTSNVKQGVTRFMDITKRRFSVGNNDPASIKEFIDKLKTEYNEDNGLAPEDEELLRYLEKEHKKSINNKKKQAKIGEHPGSIGQPMAVVSELSVLMEDQLAKLKAMLPLFQKAARADTKMSKSQVNILKKVISELSVKRLRDLLASLLAQQDQLVVAVSRSKKFISSACPSSAQPSRQASGSRASCKSRSSRERRSKRSKKSKKSKRSQRSERSEKRGRTNTRSKEMLANQSDPEAMASLVSFIRDYEILSESENGFGESMTAFSQCIAIAEKMAMDCNWEMRNLAQKSKCDSERCNSHQGRSRGRKQCKSTENNGTQGEDIPSRPRKNNKKQRDKKTPENLDKSHSRSKSRGSYRSMGSTPSNNKPAIVCSSCRDRKQARQPKASKLERMPSSESKPAQVRIRSSGNLRGPESCNKHRKQERNRTNSGATRKTCKQEEAPTYKSYSEGTLDNKDATEIYDSHVQRIRESAKEDILRPTFASTLESTRKNTIHECDTKFAKLVDSNELLRMQRTKGRRMAISVPHGYQLLDYLKAPTLATSGDLGKFMAKRVKIENPHQYSDPIEDTSNEDALQNTKVHFTPSPDDKSELEKDSSYCEIPLRISNSSDDTLQISTTSTCIPFGMMTPCTSDAEPDADDDDEDAFPFSTSSRTDLTSANSEEELRRRRKGKRGDDSIPRHIEPKSGSVARQRVSTSAKSPKIPQVVDQRDNLPVYLPLDKYVHLLVDKEDDSKISLGYSGNYENIQKLGLEQMIKPCSSNLLESMPAKHMQKEANKYTQDYEGQSNDDESNDSDNHLHSILPIVNAYTKDDKSGRPLVRLVLIPPSPSDQSGMDATTTTAAESSVPPSPLVSDDDQVKRRTRRRRRAYDVKRGKAVKYASNSESAQE